MKEPVKEKKKLVVLEDRKQAQRTKKTSFYLSPLQTHRGKSATPLLLSLAGKVVKTQLESGENSSGRVGPAALHISKDFIRISHNFE